MNCPKCNTPLDGVDGFCSNCGAFFSQESPMEPKVDLSSTSNEPNSIDPPWLNSALPASSEPSSSNDTHTSNNTHAPNNIYKPVSPNSNYSPKNSYKPGMVPYEIKKWNWGAFMFNMVWGIGNYNYLPLLCLIPVFNVIWVFVCGAKGNEWAWKSGKFNNVEDFLATQETWNRAGLVFFIINLVIVVIYILFFAVTIASAASSFHY